MGLGIFVIAPVVAGGRNHTATRLPYHAHCFQVRFFFQMSHHATESTGKILEIGGIIGSLFHKNMGKTGLQSGIHGVAVAHGNHRNICCVFRKLWKNG